MLGCVKSAARLFACLPNQQAFSTAATSSNSNCMYTPYGEDHLAIQDNLRKLIDKEINPHVDEWEAAKQFPAHEVMKLLGSNGFLGAARGKEYGGLGLDFSYTMAIAEALGTINCGGVPMAIMADSELATASLHKFGSDSLKKEFLIPTFSGDCVACLGVSEAGAGSDVANSRTTATADGDDLLITGSKMWITNGMQADWACVLVNTSASGPLHKSKSLVVVPLNAKGVTRVAIKDKLGMHSSDTAQLFFDNVRVPRRHVIGDVGRGFQYQMWQFQEERLQVVAISIAPMQKCIQETIKYCKERTVFGKPLLENQVIHYRLAELQTELESLRSLLHRTIVEYVHAGRDVTMLASMAKLKAGKLGRELPDACLQYFGGMGFTGACYVSRIYRDLRLLAIGGGADEVMMGIICKYMNTLPKA